MRARESVKSSGPRHRTEERLGLPAPVLLRSLQLTLQLRRAASQRLLDAAYLRLDAPDGLGFDCRRIDPGLIFEAKNIGVVRIEYKHRLPDIVCVHVSAAAAL